MSQEICRILTVKFLGKGRIKAVAAFLYACDNLYIVFCVLLSFATNLFFPGRGFLYIIAEKVI
jgi:hypothetical protein